MHLNHFFELLLLVINQLSQSHFKLLVLIFILLLKLTVPLIVGEFLLLVLLSLSSHLFVVNFFKEF